MFSEAIKKNNGQIAFSDYACALSLLCRGTIIDKLQWIFTLYDINKDGLLKPIKTKHFYTINF
jgi:Ca2+-binding EF-hand superfamily protein